MKSPTDELHRTRTLVRHPEWDQPHVPDQNIGHFIPPPATLERGAERPTSTAFTVRSGSGDSHRSQESHYNSRDHPPLRGNSLPEEPDELLSATAKAISEGKDILKFYSHYANLPPEGEVERRRRVLNMRAYSGILMDRVVRFTALVREVHVITPGEERAQLYAIMM